MIKPSRCVVAVVLALAIAAPSPGLAQETPAAVPADLQAGIKQVDEGDYATAVITLDRAARALAGHKERAHDLAQAYLYLGIAYVGLGSETSAKARFRDALAQSGDLALNPEQFPPKVIELFEKARDENRQLPVAQPPAAPAAKKGGSKLPLILVGAAAVVGGGVALAAGGGSSSAAGSSASSGCRTTTATVPAGAWTHTGATLAAGDRLTISASGTWNGDAGWGESGPDGIVGQRCDASSCPVPGGALHSLVGRIAFGTPFAVGSGLNMTAPVSGDLDLGMNTITSANAGALTATITACPK